MTFFADAPMCDATDASGLTAEHYSSQPFELSCLCLWTCILL